MAERVWALSMEKRPVSYIVKPQIPNCVNLEALVLTLKKFQIVKGMKEREFLSEHFVSLLFLSFLVHFSFTFYWGLSSKPSSGHAMIRLLQNCS